MSTKVSIDSRDAQKAARQAVAAIEILTRAAGEASALLHVARNLHRALALSGMDDGSDVHRAWLALGSVVRDIETGGVLVESPLEVLFEY